MSVLSEIQEQTDTIERTVTRNAETAEAAARKWRAEGIDQVVIAARGTSDNAARYAQYVWGAQNRMSVGLAAPSLFSVYKSAPRLSHSAVVGISQSGQSPDIVGGFGRGQQSGRTDTRHHERGLFSPGRAGRPGAPTSRRRGKVRRCDEDVHRRTGCCGTSLGHHA